MTIENSTTIRPALPTSGRRSRGGRGSLPAQVLGRIGSAVLVLWAAVTLSFVSLQVAPGVDVVDTPSFPAAYKDEALAAREFLRFLRAGYAPDWSFVSPSALLLPGERTGKFRIGGDQLLVDADGNSRISIEDLAVALIDELESPRHSRQRFTVGY